MWYKVLILPCGFRPGNAHKTRKTKSFFFVLCHGVPVVIDYIFNFCNDCAIYCLIYTHLFAHAVLNGRVYLTTFRWTTWFFFIFFSEQSDLGVSICALFFRVAFSLRAKPITLLFTRTDFCSPASHSIWNRGLTTTGNGQEPCILISKVTQLHFHIRILSLSQENVFFFESSFLERNVSNHSDLLICGLFWKKDFNPVFSAEDWRI